MTVAFYRCKKISELCVANLNVCCYLPEHCLLLSNHIVEDEGEFIAYKMTRTLVINPMAYEGLIVKKIFSDGKTYSGTISLTFLVSSRCAVSPPYHRVPYITSNFRHDNRLL